MLVQIVAYVMVKVGFEEGIIMKNGDMPAQALSGGANYDFTHYLNTNGSSYNPECQGLTKREEFAKCAMMAILSNQGMIDILNANTIQWVNELAVATADGQLKALEETK